LKVKLKIKYMMGDNFLVARFEGEGKKYPSGRQTGRFLTMANFVEKMKVITVAPRIGKKSIICKGWRNRFPNRPFRDRLLIGDER